MFLDLVASADAVLGPDDDRIDGSNSDDQCFGAPSRFLVQDIDQVKDASPDLRYLQEAMVDGRARLASNDLPAGLASLEPGLGSLLGRVDQAVASFSRASPLDSDQIKAPSTAAHSLAIALNAIL